MRRPLLPCRMDRKTIFRSLQVIAWSALTTLAVFGLPWEVGHVFTVSSMLDTCGTRIAIWTLGTLILVSPDYLLEITDLSGQQATA